MAGADFVDEFEPTQDFKSMARWWFRDPRMTDAAKGRLAYLATHAPGYRLTMKQQVAETKTGRDAVYRHLNELIELEYLERHVVRDERGRHIETVYRWGPAIREPLYKRAWGKNGPVDAASWESGSGQNDQPPAPAAEPDLPASWNSGSGDSGSGKTGSGKRDPKNYQGSRTTKNQATTTTSGDEPPAGRGDGGSGSDRRFEEGTTLGAAEDILRRVQVDSGVTPGRMVNPHGRQQSELVLLLLDRLRAGWPPDLAVKRLTGAFAKGSVFGQLRYRLQENLAGEPPPPDHGPIRPQYRAAWCGRCTGPETRNHIDPATGATTSDPCPACAADHVKAAPA